MILFNITVGIKMAWVEKTFERVPNRKRKAGGGTYEDSELKEERDEVTKDYETLAKRLQYEKPSYIELTDRVAKRIAKDILYHETIMEHFMDQPAYKFIMNVASFTNDDVSKFWSDHIKTNKPAPYELGNDIREMAVRIARERADQDVHQWCEVDDGLFPTDKPDGGGSGGGGSGSGTPPLPRNETSPLGETKLDDSQTDSQAQTVSVARTVFSPPPPTVTPEKIVSSPSSSQSTPPVLKTPARIIQEKHENKLFIYINENRTKIKFEDIKNKEDFKNWLGTNYYDILSADEKNSLKIRIVNQKDSNGVEQYYYDFRGLRFTRAPRGPRSDRSFSNPNDRWCNEDPCGYEYINLVQPYYKRRFDFHIHDYLKNHYEEKMAYEIQKWYNSSPESIKKIFFAPVIYGHMNEVTFALTHRYPKFKNCEAVDFYHSDKHRLLFSKCVALAVRGSQVLSGKKYGLDKSFMRINLEKRRAMHAWKHMERPKKASRPGSTRSDILRTFMASR